MTVRTCAIEGCSRSSLRKDGGVRGWCRTHYKRWQRNGDPKKTVVQIGGSQGDCTVEGCENAAHARGLCSTHIRRLKFHGDLNGRSNSLHFSVEIEEWIERHVAYDRKACLVWPFGNLSNGYGVARSAMGTQSTASRVICERKHGKPPKTEMHAAHRCGNGHLGCVNPVHLYWATASQNQMDRVLHGTSNRGEGHGSAKLTAANVIAIRSLANTRSQTSLAKQFGVSKSAISSIVRRKCWAWLEDPR